MILLHALVLLSSCFPLATAQYPPEQFCFRSCELALQSVRYNATNPRTGQTCSPKTCGCVNELATTSLYLCTLLNCSEKERIEGIHSFNEACLWRANVTATPFSIVDGYSEEDVKGLRRLGREIGYPNTGHLVSEVVLPSNVYFQLCWHTLVRTSRFQFLNWC